MRFGKVDMETTFSPDTDSAVIIITNYESGKHYITYNIDGIGRAQLLQTEIADLLKYSGCPECRANKIRFVLDIPEKIKDYVKEVPK